MAVTLAKAPAKKKPPVRKTQAQLDNEAAARIAALALDPAKAEVNEAVVQAEAQRVARAKAFEGITRALGELSAGDAEALRSAYANSAQLAGQYGAGFTGTLKTLQEGKAAEASDLISRLGLGAGVQTHAAENANVSNMLGAVIPGEGLLASAPRALQLGQSHRLAAGLRLADQAGLEDYKAGQGVAGIRAEIQKLESKRPGLIMEALQDIKSQRNAERATNTQIGYLQLQQAKTKQDEAIAMTNLTGQLHIVSGKGQKAVVVNTGKPAAGSDASVAQVRAETSKANAATAAAAKKEAARIAAAQRAESAQVAANAKVSAAKIAAQKKTVSTAKNAVDAQTKFLTEGRKYVRQVAGVNEKTGKPRTMPPKRKTIMDSLVNTYGTTLIGKFGITRAQVEAWAHALVMALPNSWWQPSNYKAATAQTGKSTGSGSYTTGP